MCLPIIILASCFRLHFAVWFEMHQRMTSVQPTSNGGAATAANAIINEGNNACKRTGAAGVKKWGVDEFGQRSAQNYQNMKKGTSLTLV